VGKAMANDNGDGSGDEAPKPESGAAARTPRPGAKPKKRGR
jgi:hypothetical protein